MEESVTKKFVHEDSGSVTLFCGEYNAQLLSPVMGGNSKQKLHL